MTRYYVHLEDYCEGPTFVRVYTNPLSTKCCREDLKIHEVYVRPSHPDEIPTHYGWLDSRDGNFCMIYPSLVQVKICFPYGPEAEEARGRGRVLGLVVEKVEENP